MGKRSRLKRTGLTETQRIKHAIKRKEDEKKQQLKRRANLIKAVAGLPLCYGTDKAIQVENVQECSQCPLKDGCLKQYVKKETNHQWINKEERL